MYKRQIIGYADTLLTVRLTPERQEKALIYIENECRRLSRLSMKLLELTGLYEASEDSFLSLIHIWWKKRNSNYTNSTICNNRKHSTADKKGSFSLYLHAVGIGKIYGVFYTHF